MKTFFTQLTLIVLISASQAKDCNAILWTGLHDTLYYNNETQLNADIKKILTMSIEEKETYRRENEGAVSIGIMKILEASTDWESDEKRSKALKSYFQSDESLAIRSAECTEFKLKLVNREAVKAWQDCNRGPLGIRLESAGDPNQQQFILNLNFIPENEQAAEVKIANISIAGGVFDSVGTLTAGSVLKRFSGMSALITRKANEPVAVVVDFEGRPSATFSLDVWPPKIDIPTKQETRVCSISAFGGWTRTRGDNEMDTDGDDRVPVRCISQLEIREERNVVLRLNFYCEENGGNHTTFNGWREFPIFSAPEGNKISGIKANGGMECTLTGGTFGRNHHFNPFKGVNATFWKKLDFRVDNNGDSDHLIVGVGGDLEISVSYKPQ